MDLPPELFNQRLDWEYTPKHSIHMQARLIPTQRSQPRDRDAMFALFSTHFKTANRDVFETDLNQKNWVILLEDPESKTLKGVSTLLIYETEFAAEPLTVVYSGDTIVDPSAWSSSVLPRAWIAAVKLLRCEYTKGKLYWLLISSGYRTYRFLPTFWKTFYPRYDAATPPEKAALMEFLARQQFQQCYNKATGIVRFPHPQVLREELRDIPTERLHDPHIQFFSQSNPGYELGDELVCLTEMTEENLTRAGQRMWSAGSVLLDQGSDALVAGSVSHECY